MVVIGDGLLSRQDGVVGGRMRIADQRDISLEAFGVGGPCVRARQIVAWSQTTQPS